jgi:hypothetical protein
MSLLYYYPNRPILIPPDPENPLNPKPDYINSLEKSGQYVAEQKWNGDNCLIYTDDLSFWNREGGRLKYQPTPEVIEELGAFPKGCILNSELVHNHTITIKNFILVHCLMAYEGQPIIGSTWGESRKILETFTYGKHVVLSNLWKKGFWKLWSSSDGTIIEGIILKDPKGVLKFSTSPLKDVSWMMKIRKPSKKYPY